MKLLLPIVLLAAIMPAGVSRAAEGPLIAVASSFRELWPELIELYTQQTGQLAPRASFASSGLLGSQIRYGAPFELYLSADEASVAMLHAAGKTRDSGIKIAFGTLSLVSPRSPTAKSTDSDNQASPITLTTLQEKLEQGQPFSLAIPNPRHAPYGQAAREALQQAELWPLPSGYVLNAENAAQTLQFALSGAVDYAIVPDTLLQKAKQRLNASALPADSYQAVTHKVVLLNPASPSAEAFFGWLQSESAADVLNRNGLRPAPLPELQ